MLKRIVEKMQKGVTIFYGVVFNRSGWYQTKATQTKGWTKVLANTPWCGSSMGEFWATCPLAKGVIQRGARPCCVNVEESLTFWNHHHQAVPAPGPAVCAVGLQ